MVKFSVIVPVYKVEPYLDECIKSILGQTYTNFELILIDDGSPDHCPLICDRYAQIDHRIKVIHKANGGVTSARNEGVQNAVGEYLVFVDGDDFIGETLLEKLAAVIMEHPADLVAVGYTDYRNNAYGAKHGNGLSVGVYEGEKLNDVCNHLLADCIGDQLTQGAVSHYLWTKIVKKDFFWSVQRLIPKEIFKGEDAAAVMLLVCNCTAMYVADICEYFYRHVPTSVSRVFNVGLYYNIRMLCDFIRENCKRIPEKNINTYAIMAVGIALAQAAESFSSYHAYQENIRQVFMPQFRDIHKLPLIPNLPFKSRMKFEMIKHRCFLVYWILYHYVKKNKSK